MTATMVDVGLTPLFDRVVVRPIEPDDVTPGGIYLPDVAQERSQQADVAQERSQQAEVVAVGPGKVLENGAQISSGLVAGQRVIYAKYGGTEVKVGHEKLVVLRQDDVLAVIA